LRASHAVDDHRLYQLNQDGSIRSDISGRPLPTYTAEDISGLARVFTGYSYYSTTPSSGTFRGASRNADAGVRSMIPYASFHSTGAKTFLGVTIPASTVSNRRAT